MKLSDDRRWFEVGTRRFPVMDAHVQDFPTGATTSMRTRGVVLRFESGMDLSIIWGSATYSSNYDHSRGNEFVEEPTTVEVAVIRDNELVTLGDSNVLGWLSADQLLDVIAAVDRGELPVIRFEA